MVTHPRGSDKNKAALVWLKGLLSSGVVVRVPEIADYEVRRELLRAGKSEGVQRLDALGQELGYVPLSTDTMRRAAEFWAHARATGMPTADDKALDGDVILAAQAATLGSTEDQVVLATDNVGHLSRYVGAERWQDIA